MGSGKRWGFFGFSLLGALIFLFLILKPPFSPMPSSPTPQVISSVKKGLMASKEKNKVSEISTEALDRGSSGEFKDQPNPSTIENLSTLTEPDLKGSDRRSSIPPSSSIEKPTGKTGFKKERLEQDLSSPPLSSSKEKGSATSIKVEGERRNESRLFSEVVSHFNLGVSYQNRKEYLNAIEAYKKAIGLDPTYTEAYNNLGILYQEIGDDHHAFETYQRLIKINPNYEKAYNNLGILFYLKGQYGEALEAFQKAITINPHNIESYINLGVLYKKQGQWSKAVESYQKALSINPLHKETHYNIGLLYEQMEQVELAIGHYQKFVQLASNTHPDLVSKVQRHLNVLIKGKEGQ